MQDCVLLSYFSPFPEQYICLGIPSGHGIGVDLAKQDPLPSAWTISMENFGPEDFGRDLRRDGFEAMLENCPIVLVAGFNADLPGEKKAELLKCMYIYTYV